jgi:hypothetical protein
MTPTKRPPPTSPMPTLPAMVYMHKGLPCVPHYTKKGIYVMPGGKEISGMKLENMGAPFVLKELWPREWLQAV